MGLIERIDEYLNTSEHECDEAEDILTEAKYAIYAFEDRLAEKDAEIHRIKRSIASCSFCGGSYVDPTMKRGELFEAQKKAIDALYHFAQSVASGSSWWDDVWPNIEKELEAARPEVNGECQS